MLMCTSIAIHPLGSSIWFRYVSAVTTEIFLNIPVRPVGLGPLDSVLVWVIDGFEVAIAVDEDPAAVGVPKLCRQEQADEIRE